MREVEIGDLLVTRDTFCRSRWNRAPEPAGDGRATVQIYRVLGILPAATLVKTAEVFGPPAGGLPSQGGNPRPNLRWVNIDADLYGRTWDFAAVVAPLSALAAAETVGLPPPSPPRRGRHCVPARDVAPISMKHEMKHDRELDAPTAVQVARLDASIDNARSKLERLVAKKLRVLRSSRPTCLTPAT